MKNGPNPFTGKMQNSSVLICIKFFIDNYDTTDPMLYNY